MSEGVPVVETNMTMCAPGYPESWAAAASTVKPVHRVTTVAIQRDRFVATGVTVPQIADRPSDPSASTSELRT